jgi:dienelactone hydrolase
MGETPDVAARRFDISRQGRVVPGVVWSPPVADSPRPLVLLGHGGSGDKWTVAPLAERLVAERGYVVAAIDGPVHGDRRPAGAPGDTVLELFRALWLGGTQRIDEMVADWRAAIDHLLTMPEVDTSRIGWAGTSMGTAYGLPLLAAEPRVRAAVLGMWGLSYPNSERLAADAPDVRCPVLFQRQADDRLFTVEGQEALFALLGSTEKRLAVYPGTHGPAGPEQSADSVSFLASRLDPAALGAR